mmetsp:Transcript_25682/g.64744  ORF Transcript_25682/g.64744 Transcript_25682/m.64744 type:complete len:485 (-) Transcript_25682:351-1805(-)
MATGAAPRPFQHLQSPAREADNAFFTCDQSTFDMLVEVMQRVVDEIGPDETEPNYQLAAKILLKYLGHDVETEELQGCKFMNKPLHPGKADIVVGLCVVELKADMRCAYQHRGQVRRYIRCKNQELLGERVSYRDDSETSPYFGTTQHAKQGNMRGGLYWGIIINVAKNINEIQYFVPGYMTRHVSVPYNPRRGFVSVDKSPTPETLHCRKRCWTPPQVDAVPSGVRRCTAVPVIQMTSPPVPPPPPLVLNPVDEASEASSAQTPCSTPSSLSTTDTDTDTQGAKSEDSPTGSTLRERVKGRTDRRKRFPDMLRSDGYNGRRVCKYSDTDCQACYGIVTGVRADRPGQRVYEVVYDEGWVDQVFEDELQCLLVKTSNHIPMLDTPGTRRTMTLTFLRSQCDEYPPDSTVVHGFAALKHEFIEYNHSGNMSSTYLGKLFDEEIASLATLSTTGVAVSRTSRLLRSHAKITIDTHRTREYLWGAGF